jgi:membrane associated rhomboid family serine protease
VSHLWGIITAPFLHASFQHLISNTVPLVFMGLIIALAGAARLAAVTAIVIVLGGLGTWLISPAHSITVGASGLVFGYATYLLVRGFFDRSALELMAGIVVGVIWGGALIGSLLPQDHISWQGHLCGGIAGVVAAYLMRKPRPASAPAVPAIAQ